MKPNAGARILNADSFKSTCTSNFIMNEKETAKNGI